VVVVATVRALKHHGGVSKSALAEENLAALRAGFANLEKQVENVRLFGLPAVVAVNRFPTDTAAELEEVQKMCKEAGFPCALAEVWEKGGEGGLELAEKVVQAASEPSNFHFLYDPAQSPKEKIAIIASRVYGAARVEYTARAERDLQMIHEQGLDNLLICMAKTQYSLSDNPALLGRPSGFTLTVREVRLAAGAGFIIPVTGEIMTMPGLPKHPAALDMDIDDAGHITGLF
jgi:formate--tetrahydrofolate ligase